MKMKIIICGIIILIIIVSGTIIGFNYKNKIKERDQKRYAEIKENIQPEIDAYVRLTNYYCNPERGENSGTRVYNEFDWVTYLKCKDYEDTNYSNWENRK